MLVLLQVLLCVWVADFVSGFVHWLEDAYGHEELPVLGSLVTQRNNLHHKDPSAFARFGWWHGSWLLHLIAGAVGLALWALGLFTWQVALVLVIGANANHLHKWAHRSRRRNGPVVTWLQDVQVLQSQRHHARHHRGSERTHYCVVTPHLNPLLDQVGFWGGLERLVELVTGVARRDPGQGRILDPRLLAMTASGTRPEGPEARG